MDEFVTIEVQQLTGEMALDIKLLIRASEIEAHAKGSHVTWGAEGVRVVVPSSALATLHETIARLVHESETPEQTPIDG